ncbi:MAG: AcrR family transcriptional regulator [Mariniblastus sp.]|jgi:AcrR family transcriptional regulator
MSNATSPKSDSTRDRILLEAGPIFASKGYRATTIREICDHASVNLASINYYFGDKQKLYFETVVLAREMRVRQVPYPSWDGSTLAEEKLGDFIRLILKRLVTMKSEPWQVQLLMREILQPTEACRHLVEEYFRPFFDTLCGVIDELVGKRLPDHQRSQIGFSIIGQCLYYRFSSDITTMMIEKAQYEEHFGTDGLSDHIYEFSLGAIHQIRARITAEENEKMIGSSSTD